MIRVEQLSKVYRRANQEFTALNNINLTIEAGEIFGIIGKSGAGKSTLIHCLNLLEQPTAGAIYFDDRNILLLSPAELRKTRQQIGMIFQQFNLLHSRTVFQNIALPLQLNHQSKLFIHKKVNALLELVGLSEKALSYPAQLSGGQQQRVAIARALANDPKVLLCDEATSALDPKTTRSILELLQKINQELNLTIILITHELDIIKQICHRVALLKQGTLIEAQNTVDFFVDPKSDYAKEFIRLHLPKALKTQIQTQPMASGKPVLQLLFTKTSAREPIISQFVQSFNSHVTILLANIDTVGQESIGHMVIALSEFQENLQPYLEFFQQQQVKVELLGYVA
ncbi:MAG: ATP-binding cassette domain-containing protein [Legionellales bacterium]|nr:ATP-binding cassette domain-containing protein [Legionellales bacterium]